MTPFYSLLFVSNACNPIIRINFAVEKLRDRNKMYNNDHFTTNNPPCQA